MGPARREDLDLVGLALVAEIERDGDLGLAHDRSLRGDPGFRLGFERGDRLGDVGPAVPAAGIGADQPPDRPDIVAPDVGEDRAKRAKGPRRRRHRDRLELRLLGEQARVGRPGAAIGHQRELARVDARRREQLHDLRAHLGARHAHGRFGCRDGAIVALHAQPVGDRFQGRCRGGRIERHAPAEEGRRVDDAECHVAVGQRRLAPAPPVADRSRVGAGGQGADLEEALCVDPDDRPSSGPDRTYIDDRHDEREIADEGGGGEFGRAALADRDVRRRPAHVEGDQLGPPRGGAESRRGHHTGGGAGENGIDRPGARGLEAERAAVVGGDVDGRGDAHPFQTRLQAIEIARHQRMDVGVEPGHEATLIFPDLGPDQARFRDEHAREPLAKSRSGGRLQACVPVGVEQQDRDGLDLRLPQPLGQRVDLREVERHHHGPIGTLAGADLEDEVTRHQRRLARLREIVGARQPEPRDLEQVAIAA